MINSIKDVVENDLCVSCGACCGFTKENAVTMKESKSKGIFVPVVNIKTDVWGEGDEFKVCPGKGYPIRKMGVSLFPDAPNDNVEIGRWHKAYVTRSLLGDVVEDASSGGIMTGIAKYLLEEGVVDGAVVTRMKFGDGGPRPESFIATSFKELREAQGSKYVPVPIFDSKENIENFNGKLVFIGTPCQVAALRLLQESKPELKRKVVFTIANFCGGYRDLRETDKLIERASIDKKSVNFLRYRGGGQPGSMLIKNKEGDQKLLAYPGYARMTGVIKHLRCRLCVDATGELADFSCGDAWISEYLKSGKSWSIVVARSSTALALLQKLERHNMVELNDVSTEDIKKSQQGNLTTKKLRQESRIKLYKILGIKVPVFDGGYHRNQGGLVFELKVHLSHSFFSLLEKLGLYKIFAKLIGRYPKG